MPKMPSKILLVYPAIPADTYWSFSHALGLVGKQCAMPPLGLLTALPGTRLFQRLQEEGRLRAAATGNNTHTFGTNFCPRMGTSQLTSGYRRLLKELYGGNLKSYFQRCNRLFDRIAECLPKQLPSQEDLPQEGATA